MGHKGGISDLKTSVCLLIPPHKIHNAPHFAFSMELGLIEINLEGVGKALFWKPLIQTESSKEHIFLLLLLIKSMNNC